MMRTRQEVLDFPRLSASLSLISCQNGGAHQLKKKKNFIVLHQQNVA